MVALFTPPVLQSLDTNGNPYSGAKLYFYETGTTTPITVYQDSGLATPHANPVVADASGQFAPIYVNTGTYKVVLTTSADVTVRTVDPVYGDLGGTIAVDLRALLDVPPYIATRTDLKALDTTKDKVAFLYESGREGWFIWTSGDYSTQITADSAEGVYLKANAIASTSGAWVRWLINDVEYDCRWFGVSPGEPFNGTRATANVTAFNSMISVIAAGSRIMLPLGLIPINATLAFTKAISIEGRDKLRSGFYGVSMTSDSSLLDYQGTTGARIQDVSLRSFSLWSDNNLARGMTLTWFNKYNCENLYFYQLYRGWFGDNAWSGTWSNISAFSITTETALLTDECNNILFNRCEFRGAYGIRVTGNCAGISFAQCDIEGITANDGIYIAPTTGNTVRGVAIVGNYFENIKGRAVVCDGADANSVQGITITGNYFFGGHAAYFSSTAGQAQYAIVLSKTEGFNASHNNFFDWQTAAFSYIGTEIKGVVENNTMASCPALNNNGNAFQPSVRVLNNTYGRKEEWHASIPVTGSYRTGDLAWLTSFALDGNGMILVCYPRITTGAGHVAGTDWGRGYLSDRSPAF